MMKDIKPLLNKLSWVTLQHRQLDAQIKPMRAELKEYMFEHQVLRLDAPGGKFQLEDRKQTTFDVPTAFAAGQVLGLADDALESLLRSGWISKYVSTLFFKEKK